MISARDKVFLDARSVLLLCVSGWFYVAPAQDATCRLKGDAQDAQLRCGNRSGCRSQNTETCPMASMKGATKVFPGGGTRCISKWSSEYAFSVIPGRSDKLLVYFEGGGACIDPITTALKACDEDVATHPLGADGVFDRKQAGNSFANFTVVYITYCSGDLFAGSVDKSYGSQYGLVNTRAATDWAKANVAPRLHTLVLMGCSGGSLGVQLWARTLLRKFSYDRAAVIADSFICVMPLGAQSMLLQSYGICDNGLLSSSNAAWCRASNLTIPKVFASTMAEFPEVTFASVNSKGDKEQIRYYNMVAKIFKAQPASLDATIFFKMANKELAVYNRHPNYVSFWVSGEQHCFTPYSNLYTLDASGAAVGYVVLANWLALLPVMPGYPAGSQCAGQQLSEPQWPIIGTAYCDKAQANKVYQARLAPTSTTTPVEVGPRIPSPLLSILGCAAFVLVTCILCICCYMSGSDDDDEEEEETDDEEELLDNE